MNNYFVTINDKEHHIKYDSGNSVIINDKKLTFELADQNGFHFSLRFGNETFDIIKVQEADGQVSLLIDGIYYDAKVQSDLERKAAQLMKNSKRQNHLVEVKSPMPGMVLKINKKVGEEVKLGEPVVILEAMKMENVIKSTSSGVIKEIFVKENNPVEKGAILFRIG